MQQLNHYLAHELERMRHADIRAELERERFLAEHGLDLWSTVRRSFRGLIRREAPRADQRGSGARGRYRGARRALRSVIG